MSENERIVKNPNGTVTVYLLEPISAEVKSREGDRKHQTFESVTFRQFSFGDLKALANLGDKNELFQGYWMLKTLSDVPEIVFDKISGDDFVSCMQAITGFLPKSLQTSLAG